MERKFTIFALCYFVFEVKFRVQALRGAYIRRGDLTEGFLRYDFGGLIHGGAYFGNFYGIYFEELLSFNLDFLHFTSFFVLCYALLACLYTLMGRLPVTNIFY